MKLNPGQLEVFCVVADCGSIRAAARRLGLTQPAVTYVVRELERQAGAALWLSLLGYTGYYLLLVLAIQAAGAALPVLIIGTIPLWMMVLGKPQGLRWRALVPGLLLTGAGMVLMMQATTQGSANGAVPDVWLGVFYAVLAMASWTAFGLLNARWLARHPEVNSTVWANWLGVAAGVGALLVWPFAGPFIPLVFWAVNGWLLGQEYFTLVAQRRMSRIEAKRLRRVHRGTIWLAGILMAAPLSVPVLNLLIPVFGVATFTHLFHRLHAQDQTKAR